MNTREFLGIMFNRYDSYGKFYVEYRMLNKSANQRICGHVTNFRKDRVPKQVRGFDAYYGVLPRFYDLPPRDWTRGKKMNIKLAGALWCDVDAKSFEGGKEEALSQFVNLPKPSLLVDTGGGYHGYWFLREVTEDIKLVERINKGIATVLGGDPVHDCTRITRLPGTLNYKYATPRLCDVVEDNLSTDYKLTTMSMFEVDQPEWESDGSTDSGEDNLSEQEIYDILKQLPTQLPYEDWRNVCWYLFNRFDKEAFEIIENWSPDTSEGQHHIQDLYRLNEGRIGVGTVINIANKHRAPVKLIF